MTTTTPMVLDGGESFSDITLHASQRPTAAAAAAAAVASRVNSHMYIQNKNNPPRIDGTQIKPRQWSDDVDYGGGEGEEKATTSSRQQHTR